MENLMLYFKMINRLKSIQISLKSAITYKNWQIK